MALKEFPANGNSHAALFDITRGDFSFTAGKLAKAGHLEIATPFANIRGRSRVGGIGTLSLISLFFAAMEKVQAASPAIGYLDDGVIIPNYKDDEPHGSFELVTKEATPRRIFVDDPGVTWALRLNSSSELSVSQVSNSPAQMIQLQAIQQNVLRTYAVGLQAMQGPTVSGPNGSPTPIFDLPGSNLQRINFGPSDNSPAIENLNSSPQSSPNSSSLKTTSATTSTSESSQNTASSIEESIFIPPPPPPPPANVLTPPVITTTAPALDNASSINIAGTAPANSTVALVNNGNAIGTTTADASGHWSINGIALSNGANYTFTATATDVSNNSSPPSNQLAFQVDQTPPAVPVITTTAPAQNNASSINVAGTAEANSTVTLSNNGSPVGTTTADGSGHWSVNGIPLSNGADNNFTATATDAANNASGPSNALTFHDDQTAPSATFPTVALASDTGAASSDFITSNGGVHFAGTAADTGGAGLASVQVFNGATLLGTATVVAGNWSLDTTLAAGSYNNLMVTVTDLAGNTNTTTNTQTIIVDTAPPAAGTLSFSNLTDSGTANTPPVTTDNIFNLTLTGQESGATVAYQASLNGGAFAATTASQSGLADGDYQFRALVTDAAGNTSTSTVIEVVVDNSVPAAGTLSFSNLTDSGAANTPPVTTDNTFNLTLTGQESGAAVAYQASLNGGAFAATTASQSSLPDGDYQFRALVTDAAGNTSTSNVIEVVVDNSVPAAGTLSFSNLT
ncbi:MAG: Ig-like domain-containing protein, partial [Pseudolabrys sp.]